MTGLPESGAGRAYDRRVTTPEEDRLLELALHPFIGGGGTVCATTIDGNPRVKKRPRLGARHTYAPDAADEQATAWLLRQALHVHYDGPVVLVCAFHRADRRRVDCDNLMKHLSDAGTTARLWNDDSQVEAIVAKMHYGCPRPRTVLALADRLEIADSGQDSCENGVLQRPKRRRAGTLSGKC